MRTRRLPALLLVVLMMGLMLQTALVSATITGVSSYTQKYEGIRVVGVHSEGGVMTFEVSISPELTYSPIFKLDGETVSGTCKTAPGGSLCTLRTSLYVTTSATYDVALEVFEGAVRREGPRLITGLRQDASLPSVVLVQPDSAFRAGQEIDLAFAVSDLVDSGVYALEVVLLDEQKATISPKTFLMEGKKINELPSSVRVAVPPGTAFAKARAIDALGVQGPYSAPVSLLVDEDAPWLYGRMPVCLGTQGTGCKLPHLKGQYATQEPDDYLIRIQFSDTGGVDTTKLSSFTLDVTGLVPNYVQGSSLPASSCSEIGAFSNTYECEWELYAISDLCNAGEACAGDFSYSITDQADNVLEGTVVLDGFFDNRIAELTDITLNGKSVLSSLGGTSDVFVAGQSNRLAFVFSGRVEAMAAVSGLDLGSVSCGVLSTTSRCVFAGLSVDDITGDILTYTYTTRIGESEITTTAQQEGFYSLLDQGDPVISKAEFAFEDEPFRSFSGNLFYGADTPLRFRLTVQEKETGIDHASMLCTRDGPSAVDTTCSSDTCDFSFSSSKCGGKLDEMVFEVFDRAGNKGTYDPQLPVDRTPPEIESLRYVIDDGPERAFDGKLFTMKDSSIKLILGILETESLFDESTVRLYCGPSKRKELPGATCDDAGCSWEFIASACTNSDLGNLYFVIKDRAGNEETYSPSARGDEAPPEVLSLKVKVGDGTLKEFTGQEFFGKNQNIIFEMEIKDEGTGFNEDTVRISEPRVIKPLSCSKTSCHWEFNSMDLDLSRLRFEVEDLAGNPVATGSSVGPFFGTAASGGTPYTPAFVPDKTAPDAVFGGPETDDALPGAQRKSWSLGAIGDEHRDAGLPSTAIVPGDELHVVIDVTPEEGVDGNPTGSGLKSVMLDASEFSIHDDPVVLDCSRKEVEGPGGKQDIHRCEAHITVDKDGAFDLVYEIMDHAGNMNTLTDNILISAYRSEKNTDFVRSVLWKASEKSIENEDGLINSRKLFYGGAIEPYYFVFEKKNTDIGSLVASATWEDVVLTSLSVSCSDSSEPDLITPEALTLTFGSDEVRFSDAKTSTTFTLEVPVVQTPADKNVEEIEIKCELTYLPQIENDYFPPQKEAFDITLAYVLGTQQGYLGDDWHPVGGHVKSYLEDIKEAYVYGASGGIWESITALEELLEYAAGYCRVGQIIQTTSGLVKGIDVGITTARAVALGSATPWGAALYAILSAIHYPLKITYESLDSIYDPGRLSGKTAILGWESGIGKWLCWLGTCGAQETLPKINEVTRKAEDAVSLKGFGLSLSGNSACEAAIYAVDAVSLDNVLRGGGLQRQSEFDALARNPMMEKVVEDAIEEGYDASRPFALPTNTLEASRKSIYVAAACVCVPAIIGHLNQWRQNACQEAYCIQEQTKGGLMKPLDCHKRRTYQNCAMVFGGTLDLLGQDFRLLVNKIIDVYTSPKTQLVYVAKKWLSCTEIRSPVGIDCLVRGSTTREDVARCPDALFTWPGCQVLSADEQVGVLEATMDFLASGWSLYGMVLAFQKADDAAEFFGLKSQTAENDWCALVQKEDHGLITNPFNVHEGSLEEPSGESAESRNGRGDSS